MGTFTAPRGSNDVVHTISGDIDGRPCAVPPHLFVGGRSVFRGTATYRCDGRTMVTQSPGTPFHHTWHRINAPG